MTTSAVVALLACLIAYKALVNKRSHVSRDLIEGKRVVITGASQNIGEELAYQYCRLGANVFITARREEKLREVTQKCMELGASSCGYFPLDMAELTQIPKFIEKANDFLGGIDYLVMNHIMRTLTLEWTSSQENLDYLDKSIKVNYLSYIHLSSAAQRHLTTSGGHLVVISSLAGMTRTLNTTAYGATKAALNRFYDNSRYEMMAHGREGYSITSCMLGLIATESDYSRKRDLKITAYPVNQTAMDIISAAAMKERDAFIPGYTELFYIVQTLLPYRLVDRIFLKFVYGISV